MWMDEEGHGWTWMDMEGHGGTRVGHVCAITQYCSDSRSQVERRRGCQTLPARTRRVTNGRFRCGLTGSI
jgi:hypothetical protein